MNKQKNQSIFSTQIKKCRICGNSNLVSILNLGIQALTGVFPKRKDQKVAQGSLELVKCCEKDDPNSCGLVQLLHSGNPDEMFGSNYGYRSGLNQFMVRHLQYRVDNVMELVRPTDGDLILDIGSNDSTLLGAYPQKDFVLVGIDPTGKKFKEYYPPHIKLIPDFFSVDCLKSHLGEVKAKVITSIAMFYDLEMPLEFMKQVKEVLAKDGVWVFEQSYLPTMLKMNAYDTICHEHLSYYCLKQIKWMTDHVGLKLLNIEFNKVNGGSFCVTATRSDAPYPENTELVEKILQEEQIKGYSSVQVYEDFKHRVLQHREKLVEFLDEAVKAGKKIIGYGASTKGNVVLQFCNITEKQVPFIGEVNQDKFGCYTPGTLIPIISEQQARAMEPDYFLVLPWHLKDSFLVKEKQFLEHGGRLLFPLPQIMVV